MKIVNYAIEEKKTRKRLVRQGLADSEFESIWCVFDVERPHRNPKLREAVDKAKANGISVALSNRCFEYWLLLHYEHTNSPESKCDDHAVRLRKSLPSYNKTDSEIVARISQRVDIAIDRAEKLENSVPWDERIWLHSSSTRVHHLCRLLKDKRQ